MARPPRFDSLAGFGALEEVLAVARQLGFLGPGPVAEHAERALDLAAAISTPPDRAVDLGSGGGIPGLPLALAWPSSHWLLVESSTTRGAFLNEAIQRLGLSRRVLVAVERAEEAGRGPWRASADLVVARSFGPPATTAECAAPFLSPGGTLVVAEPPGGRPGRWPPEGLGELGLAVDLTVTEPTSFQLFRQVTTCPERYPRRVGVPAKRPLF